MRTVFKKETEKLNNYMESVWYFIYNFFRPSIKAGGIIVSIVSIIYLLLPVYEKLIDTTIVRWTFVYFQNNSTFGILYICSIVLVTITLCKWLIKHNNQWIQWKYINILIGLFLIWIYYRFFSQIWSFERVLNSPITYVDMLALFDFILIVCAVYVNVCVYRRLYMPHFYEDSASILNSDSPIHQASDDEFYRTKIIHGFVKNINKLDVSKSGYSVAITAPWGNGKTSFINLLGKELEKSTNIRLINFTPWLLIPGTSITKAFYFLLAQELGGVNRYISCLIKQYLNLLEANFGKEIPHVFKTESLADVYSKICEILGASTERIIVIIDDIDRLSSEEILEVFRIIRGSANFPNIVFISCFDKEYVNAALLKYSETLKKTYIEKFFQLEFPLPPYDKNILRKMAMKFAKQLFSNTLIDLDNFNDYIKASQSHFFQNDDIINYFDNPRQLIRWLNNLCLSYSAIKGECHIADLGDIELLKMFYPTLYSLLSNSFSEYFIVKNGKIELWDKKEASENYNWIIEVHKDLHETKEYTELNLIERERFDSIINRLLGGKSSKNEPLRFATPGYSLRYFYGMLQGDEMSQIEFRNLLDMPFDAMIEKLEKDYIHRISSLTLLCQTVQVDSIAHEENIIRIVLYLSSISDFFAFDVSRLMKRLEKLANSKEEREDLLLNFIKSMPLSQWVSLVFCRSNHYRFLIYLQDEHYESLSEDFMDQIQIINMKKAYTANLTYDGIREFYRLCCHNFFTKSQLENNILTAKDFHNPSDEIMREYIVRFFERELEYLYYKDKRYTKSSTSPNKYGISWPFNVLWDSWGDFMKYTENHSFTFNNTNKLEELGILYDKYKHSGNSICYELKYLNAPKW